MNESAFIEGLYPHLPRFVADDESVIRVGGIYLPSLVRDFEWNGVSYEFIISPARVRNAGGADEYHYPGQRERAVEFALRRLAAEARSSAVGNSITIHFSLERLLREIYAGYREPILTAGEIALAVRILANVQYELIGGGAEFCFRPLESFVVAEKHGNLLFRVDLPAIPFFAAEDPTVL